jgi:hypothetical protein
VRETMLAAIFVIHAIAFTYFYLRRGRRAFHLLFCGGFVLLAGYYAYNSWEFFAGVKSAAPYLHYARWGGLILCALATPFFLADVFRRRRGKGSHEEDL